MNIISKIKNLFKNDEETKIYSDVLSKTKKDFLPKLVNLFNKHSGISENFFVELEEIFIVADIGVTTTLNFIDKLRKRVVSEKITNILDIKDIIIDELFILYVSNEVLVNKINFDNNLTVILVVGVNGVGKTTTIGKLAYKLKNENKKVMLIAGDTFRAGATEQIEEWAKRAGVAFVGKGGSDPGSVIYGGLNKAIEEGYDVVLIDTAGRLQNKTNLMNELVKINKVINNIIPNSPHETLLIIDATTGQNGINQAKAFKEITNITGIVLTKLEGTAKGGIILAIKDELNIPVKFIGVGEKLEDLKVFDIEKYIYSLFEEVIW